MRMKRLITFLLAACLCLSLWVPALAAGTVLKVEQPEKLPAVGETFTVTVSIEGNTGFNAAQMALLYDSGVVKCTKVKAGDVMSDMMSAVNPEAEKHGTSAMIAAAGLDAATKDGQVAVFTFEVLKDGDAKLDFGEMTLSDDAGKDLDFTVTGADITPEKPEEETEEKPEEEAPEEVLPGEQRFTDVPASHWAFEYVNKAAEQKLVKGYNDGSFGPERQMTRAEFVTILWRMSGSPEPKKPVGFSDVAADQWFAKQIAWASESGFVKGSGDSFNPNGFITREQVMSILYRYNGGASGTESMFTGIYDSTFTDSGSISDWAKDAVYWAIYEGIVGGMTETTIVPQGNATRAQISAIFLRYLDSVHVEEEE